MARGIFRPAFGEKLQDLSEQLIVECNEYPHKFPYEVEIRIPSERSTRRRSEPRSTVVQLINVNDVRNVYPDVDPEAEQDAIERLLRQRGLPLNRQLEVTADVVTTSPNPDSRNRGNVPQFLKLSFDEPSYEKLHEEQGYIENMYDDVADETGAKVKYNWNPGEPTVTVAYLPKAENPRQLALRDKAAENLMNIIDEYIVDHEPFEITLGPAQVSQPISHHY